jgi:hypothetical protein
MDRKAKTKSFERNSFDLTTLLHPARAFARPMDIVRDHDLTLSEKRAMLAAWASDACAVEANPTLRKTRGQSTAQFDEIMDVLRELDRLSPERYKPIPHYRKVLEVRNGTSQRRRSRRGDENDDRGAPLH